MDRNYQKSAINGKTAEALSELGRAAARVAGIPDDVPISMTVCADREYQWCGLVDGELIDKEDRDVES